MILKPIDGSKKIKLSQIDTDSKGGLTEEKAEEITAKTGLQLRGLGEMLYAAHTTPVLIVLQGMDTSGKDGTIRHVMGFLNPQNCNVASFKVPTPLEQAHDFLWRAHQQTPESGTATIFNRSYYEDVLVVRVHNLIPKASWSKRYEHIVNFEQMLTDEGVVILKFFLHISKAEQKRRLLEREEDPTKAWKLSAGDWKERELWDDYQQAYEDAINKTSTKAAPWIVVPGDHKWYRDLVVSDAIVSRLKPLEKSWTKQLEQVAVAAKAELAAFRAENG